MTQPDVQFFDRAGTWIRPPGAAQMEVIHCYPPDDSVWVTSRRGLDIPAHMDVKPEGHGGYALVVTRLARQEQPAPRPQRTRTPGAEWPQRGPCPACGEPVLVTLGSRHGGQAEVFDPEPGCSDQHNTLLSDDRSYVSLVAAKTSQLRGKVPLWRPHRYACDMRVPGDLPLPNWGGYSHAAARRKPG